MIIFSGTSNRPLAEKICEYLNEPLGDVDIQRFPDGEVFVKVNVSIRGMDVFVVQPICTPPNEALMELLIMIDAMKRASAKRITAVIPYYGYARQDRKDQPRVPITSKLVANLLVASGVDRILTMDLHAHQIMGFFDIPVDHLYASPVILEYLKSKNPVSPVIVSPDTGAVKAANAYSQTLGWDLAIVAKQRLGPDEVKAITVVGDVKGKTAFMIDDMTSTAGTLSSAADILLERGAKEVYAAVTHLLLNEKGVERMQNSSIKELVVTDTVPLYMDIEGLPITRLSVSSLIGEAILRIHEDRSVSSLIK